jgi:hypothetical protein
LVYTLYIVEPKNDANSAIIWVDGEEIELEDIEDKILEWRGQLSEADQPKLTVRLSVHSGVEMGLVNKVKDELSRSFALKIAYAVAPIKSDLDSRFYRNHSIIAKLRPTSGPFFEPEEYINSINSIENPIVIRHTSYSDSILYNKELMHIEQFSARLKMDISGNPNYLIKYYFEDSVDYANYISIISTVKLCVEELRDSYSLKHYSLNFDELEWHDLYWDKASEIKKRFHYRLLEVNEDFAKQLDR